MNVQCPGTLVEGLAKQAAEQPTAVAFWLESLENPPVEVTYQQLDAAAAAAAHGLQSLGLEPGGRALLMLPTSVDFVRLFYGTLLARGTPVPAYPPAGWRQLEAFPATLARLAKAAGARMAVIPELLREMLAGKADALPPDVAIVTPEQIQQASGHSPAALPSPCKNPQDLALIQFSSGSTGDPRGICLTHANVLYNMQAFADRLQRGPADVCVSWLPLYHDMGLIGTLLGALFHGVPLVLFPPTDFLRQPSFWLRVLAKYRGTIGVAPQFAYSLCTRKVDPAGLKDVDLSSVRVLLNGAEPIHVKAVAAFEERFRPLGLRPHVVTPCYGLGEGTLAVTMQHPGRELTVLEIEPENGYPTPSASSGAASRMEVVSVGPPMDGSEVRILSAEGGWEADGRIGEICVRGPSVCRGYTAADGIEPATDPEGWLHTGDLGLLHEGELYVTGRKKDLIIVGGRNLYPQEVEEEAGRVPGLRPGRIAAFGVAAPDRGTEVLVIVAETTQPEAPIPCVTQLRQRLLERFGVVPHDLVLIGRGHIPLTTSGKLRRYKARSEYERNGFGEVIFRLRSRPGEPQAAGTP